MKDNSKSGCARVIVILGLIASLLTIFTFLTGIAKIQEILRWPTNNSSGDTKPMATLVSAGVSENTATYSPSVIGSNRDWVFSGLQGEKVSFIATGKGHIVYAGTNNNEHGVFKTSDDGASWSARNNGLGELDIYHLVIAPEDPNKVIVTTENLIWISSDGGISWNPTKPSDLSQSYPVALGSPDGKLLIAVEKYINTFQSTNGGISWKKIADFGNCTDMYSVLSSGRIYCIRKNGGPDSVSRSDDQGRTWWTAASVGSQYNLTTIAINNANDSIVYVGTESYGIYKSTDGGGSWSPINNMLPNQGHDLYINSIVIDPIISSTVYISVSDFGVYKSPDGGQTWELLTNGLASEVAGKVLSLGLSIDSPRYLFAGTDGSGIFKYQIP
jgi:photosystem II stability/assembly factor-like uncharacterized protein